MTPRHFQHLIIGNSAGGIAAAEAIRELDRESTLCILSDEPYPAYSRPLISEYLADPCPVEKIAYRRPDFYEKNGIETVLGCKAAAIDIAGRTVVLAGGEKLSFEKLLLATGGTPIVPGMPGIDSPGVFTLNRLDDAKAIDRFIDHRHRKVRAAVIGGGLIGVSVTEALLRRKVDVTMVEMQERILSVMLDETASAIEADALRGAGVTVLTGRTAVRINSNLPEEITSVTLDDGSFIHCEMVVAAIGVRPRLDALEGSGIRVNRGIVVDNTMMTSVPNIYACGDAAEAYDFIHGVNRLTPVWPNAYEGGRTAGLNMAGQQAVYPGGTTMNSMKYFGRHVVSAGLVSAPDDTYETLARRTPNVYRKVILKEGKIRGLVFAGDIGKSGIIYNLMKDGTDVTAFRESLVADDFGLASLSEETWARRISRPSAAGAVVRPAGEPEEALIGD